MNRGILIGVVLVMVLAGGYYFYNSNSTQTGVQNVNEQTNTTQMPQASSDPTSSANQGAVKEFTVTGSNFKFDPAAITVNKGDTVKITLKSSGGSHDLVIDEFNTRTKILGSGQTETIEFAADKTGSFEYYCSIGNHRQMGMVGTLIVQ